MPIQRVVRLYFAAPLFSEAELEFNRGVVELIESAGHEVFLPQRDGPEADSAAHGEGTEHLHEIFSADRQAIVESELVVAVLDGSTVDEGVAVEIGIAHENDIPIVGLKTDVRTFSEHERINSMVYSPLSTLCRDPAELVEALHEVSKTQCESRR
jgi:nucleoside 2-deoxyribosyltransferase